MGKTGAVFIKINLKTKKIMKSNKFFSTGVIAGIIAFISCLADMETMQYLFGSISLISFALSERNRYSNSFTQDQ